MSKIKLGKYWLQHIMCKMCVSNPLFHQRQDDECPTSPLPPQKPSTNIHLDVFFNDNRTTKCFYGHITSAVKGTTTRPPSSANDVDGNDERKGETLGTKRIQSASQTRSKPNSRKSPTQDESSSITNPRPLSILPAPETPSDDPLPRAPSTSCWPPILHAAAVAVAVAGADPVPSSGEYTTE